MGELPARGEQGRRVSRFEVFDDDEDRKDVRYRITLIFRHPTVDAACVSEALSWEPAEAWAAGELDVATGEIRADCGWSGFEERLGFLRVLTHLIGIVDYLEERRGFVVGYVESGGSVEAVLRLYGRVNLGDDLSPEEVMRIGMLGISVRIEVATTWPGVADVEDGDPAGEVEAG